MKKLITFFIIFSLFSANASFADSRIDYNAQVNNIKTLSNSLDILLNRYSAFLDNYQNYDGSEISSELDYLNRQLIAYYSHSSADLTQLRQLYEITTDLTDTVKIGSLYSILIDYLMAFNYLKLFNIVEDKATILFLANEYKSSADKKLNKFIENYINLH
ncbi:hypothetical protein [Faecalimicrobium dakarense]|uniref:hypothetical protein n=1 Tax=Faecalimicrobium dakarense TaxID=1301100 RepID=UPI0004B32D2C|nr:hypothetical protein [[Clostridium] dakarense]